MDLSRPSLWKDNHLVGVLVLVVPFISWGSALWPTGLFGLLVTLAFLMAVRNDPRGGKRTVRVTPLLLPFGLVMALGIVHLPLSPVPHSTLLFIVQLALAGLFYWMLVDGPPVDAWIPVLAWTVILTVWIAVGMFLGGAKPPSGPFLNPNHLATVLLTCLAWSLGSLVSPFVERPRRAILLLLSLAATAGLAVIGSRSAGLAILGLWSLFGILGKGRMRIAAFAVLALLLVVPTTLKHRVTEQYRYDPHAFSRILIWKGALEMGLDHPLIGVGPNLYYENAPPYAFPTESLPVRYGRIARKPHNEFLRAWAEGGAAGAVAAVLFLVVTWRLAAASWGRGRVGPVLAVAVLLFQALFHDLTEVFGLVALGVFWMADLAGKEGGAHEIDGARARDAFTATGAVVLLMALWLNLDVSARMLWGKSQRSAAQGSRESISLLRRAQALNPLLPGVARDLSAARVEVYRLSGSTEDLGSAEASVEEAIRLNRLDTGPLRLKAALFMERGRREPGKAGAHRAAALRLLGEALSLEPFNVLIMLARAEALREQGAIAAAVEEVDRALATEPNFLEAHRRKITLLEAVDPGAVGEAQKDLEKSKERIGNYRPMSSYEAALLR